MSEEEITSIDTKLRRLKKLALELEEAKSDRDKKIGERDALLADLRNRFKMNSVDDARKRITALDNQLARRNKAIDKQFKAIADKYEI